MLHLPLADFLDILREAEEASGDEAAFWKAHDTLNNYLAKPISKEQCKVLDEFLHVWRSVRHPINWDELIAFWTPEMQALSSVCSEHTLVACQFGQNVTFSNHQLSLGQAVEILYGRLRMVEGVGATNASKVLAVAMPKLFIMWDELNIRSLAGLQATPRSYLEFVEDMQRFAAKLINEVSTAESCTQTEAAKWLQKLPLNAEWNCTVRREKPIAKLLDEYNYRLPKSKWFSKFVETGKALKQDDNTEANSAQ